MGLIGELKQASSSTTTPDNLDDPDEDEVNESINLGPSTSIPSISSAVPLPSPVSVSNESFIFEFINSNEPLSPTYGQTEAEVGSWLAGTSCASRTTSRSRQSIPQQRIDSSFREIRSYEEGGAKGGKITNAILFMIAKDNMPFNTVEKEGFKYLMKTAAPLYKVLGRQSITTYMEEKYKLLSASVKNRLSSLDYFSLTADCWSDLHNSVSYLGMTCHYEYAGELLSTTIGVIKLSESHTADYLGQWMKTITTEWNIDDEKIVVIVTDNAANIVKAVNDFFGSNRHRPCFAHTINLVAANTLEFQDAQTVIIKIKTIVTFFKHSNLASDALRKVSVLKLIQCVDTRWNSTYYMLERFIRLADEVATILLKFPNSPPMLSAEELLLAKEIMEVMRPIEVLTKELCGEKYVTSSKLIPMVNCLKKNLESLRTKVKTETAKSLLCRLDSQISKRFGQIESSHVNAISTILDPRFKRIHFNDRVACANAIVHISRHINRLNQSNFAATTMITQDTNQTDAFDGNGLWSHHNNLVSQVQNVAEEQLDRDEMPTEFRYYLSQALSKLNENPMDFWCKKYASLYPVLRTIARKYLPLVATSVPSERLFSRAGNILTDNRSRLSSEHLQHLLFLNSLSLKDWQFD